MEKEENNESEVTEQQRPSRERKAPDRYEEWVYLAHEVDDRARVKEALSNTDKNELMRAMENEINSLHKNDVWDLMELPEDRKAVGSKWVFKRKYDADGNVECHKTRLVAQGYNQTYGIDYDETFWPVVRFESVRSVIALAAKHNLKQLDITTAFLNGELK